MLVIKHVISVISSLKLTSPIFFTRYPPINWIGFFLITHYSKINEPDVLSHIMAIYYDIKLLMLTLIKINLWNNYPSGVHTNFILMIFIYILFYFQLYFYKNLGKFFFFSNLKFVYSTFVFPPFFLLAYLFPVAIKKKKYVFFFFL